MSVLDRSALEDSPLADLHAIASELAIDGYRRLRRADLIDSILAHQGDVESADGRRGAGVHADSIKGKDAPTSAGAEVTGAEG
ncbi:MAG: Rho termination factor N-terminal domain-containing protein, partial [Actinomycetota bacterium]|nr:Rho termination factor N-terminal domain-containing protein [Actinomycetota bacterium]